MDLSGRSVIVTGAGRGLGRAYALALARAGASVVVNDADEAAAEAVAAEAVEAGGAAVAASGAVGPTATAEMLADRAVAAFGRLDGLVTNAGVLRDRILWKMSDEDFDTVVGVHLRGTFTCVRAAVQRMRAQGEGGRIIVVGSPAGQRGNVGQTNYSAAKAAIVGMVRTWAMECARDRIAVNAVIPVAATAMTRTIPVFAPYVDAWERDGRPLPGWLRAGAGFGVPEDVAQLPVFLMSEAAAAVSGQAIGLGGDRLSLWSHPRETVAAVEGGGWTAEGIAEVWPAVFGPRSETVGVPAVEAPEERA
ncbi:SDR family oxidoreductase [Glycomyces scopariae]